MDERKAQEIIEEEQKGVVDIFYKGFSVSRLREMFDRMHPEGDWKGPLRIVVNPTELDVAIVAAEYFTGRGKDTDMGKIDVLMTPRELRDRASLGEDPLDLSIDKWMRIVENPDRAASDSTYYLYADTCGLCMAYYKYPDSHLDGCCTDCPLSAMDPAGEMESESLHCCVENSLWKRVQTASGYSLGSARERSRFVKASEKMLKALQACKRLQNEEEGG